MKTMRNKAVLYLCNEAVFLLLVVLSHLVNRGVGRGAAAVMEASRVATADPFVDRSLFDFRLKPDSEAIDLGIALGRVKDNTEGEAPDVGPLELNEPMYGEQGSFPAIPEWLLDEWPLDNRGH